MSSDLVGSIVLLAVCLAVSFVFSATETAITAAGKMKLKALEGAYPNRKKGLAWLGENIHRALTVTLVGNNIANIASSTAAAMICTELLGSRRGPIVSVIVMTTIVVIFCEILPKNIAIASKESVVYHAQPFIRLASTLLAPVIAVVHGIIGLLSKVIGCRLETFGSLVTREDIEILVTASEESGALEEDERKMISGVIQFEETRVSEIMLARTDMTTVTSDTTVRGASAIFLESGHSRVPVYETELDKITGVLYVKDLLAPMTEGRLDAAVRHFARKPMFLPETMNTAEAFEQMKKSKIHIAIVVDEYGGTAGLITLEDLIEEIVGDIQDEYDDEMPDVMTVRDGVYIVQGSVNLEDLSDELGYDFDFDDVDTVAGMMLSLVGNFPQKGESVTHGPWLLTAEDVEEHRILQVRMERTSGGDVRYDGGGGS